MSKLTIHSFSVLRTPFNRPPSPSIDDEPVSVYTAFLYMYVLLSMTLFFSLLIVFLSLGYSCGTFCQ